MPEPLTIYECPTCGWWSGDPVPRTERGPHQIVCDEGLDGEVHPEVAMREVRVFREEDVRPLWDAADAATDNSAGAEEMADLLKAWDAFPASAEWRP